MKIIKLYIIPTFTLFLICFISALLLGITNDVTAPKIAQIEYQAMQDAMKEVLPKADEFTESKTDAETGCEYSIAKAKDGSVIGAAVTAIGKGGYNGDIKLMVGLDLQGSVMNISFLTIDETPSIGMKVKSNQSFMSQFDGITGSAALSKSGGKIDAVSGATKTSTGITDAVNNALLCYENIKGEVSDNG